MESPVQTTFRSATRETELAGVSIPDGTRAVTLLGSANRDPEQFSDPDVFDITRSNARSNLGFAYGEHFCVGSSLARTEATIALELLLERLPNLRLAPGENDFRHEPTWTHRGLRELHLEFDVG